MITGPGPPREPLCGLKPSALRESEPRPQALSDNGLVPVQLARYLIVLQPVADRATMRTSGRVAARQPVLYERLHLLIRELVAQLYRRVARYGS